MKPFMRPAYSAHMMAKAMSGDMVLDTSGVTTLAETNAAWSKVITVYLKDAAGNIHTWFNATKSSVAAATDASSAGTASVASADLVFEGGIARATFSGSANNWLNGTEQVETIAVTAAVGTNGNLTWRLTSTGMAGSPIDLTIPVTTADNTTSLVATKIRAAMNANAVIAARFTIGGTSANVQITRKVAEANDTSLAMALQNAGGTGVTVGSSTNTTAGVAPETATLTIGGSNSFVVMGTTLAQKTHVITVI